MPRLRTIVALVAGSVAYLLILFRFLSYSERNKLSGDVYLTFAAVALVIGFAVTLGATAGRYRTAGFVLLGVCLAHLLVIIADYQQDPTSHNLMPFEFAILCVVAAPAYAGAGIAHIVDYIRRRNTHDRQPQGSG
jgi:drug/metabolite transporter (DMT)-like permease